MAIVQRTVSDGLKKEFVETPTGGHAERVAMTWASPDGEMLEEMPVATALGDETDAPLAGETAEGATARSGISLWKRMVNKLIDIKSLLAALGATTDAAASSTVAEDGTARTGISLWKAIKNLLLLLVAPAALTETTATCAQTASETGEIALGGAGIVMIYPPAAVEATTAQISIKAGRETGSRAQLNDDYGVKVVIPFTAGQPISVDPSRFPALRFISFVLETSAGVAVAQATAARAFIVVTRRV